MTTGTDRHHREEELAYHYAEAKPEPIQGGYQTQHYSTGPGSHRSQSHEAKRSSKHEQSYRKPKSSQHYRQYSDQGTVAIFRL